MGHRYAILSSSSKVLHVHFSMTTSLQRQYYHSLISDQNIISLEVTQWDCHGNRQKVSRSPTKPLYVKTFWVHCLFLLKTKPNFPKYEYIQSGRRSLLQNDHLATGTPPVSSNATPRTQRATSTLVPRGKDFSRIGW